MTLSYFQKINAERSIDEKENSSYYFFEHQKVYEFCFNKIKNKNVLEIGSGSGYGTYRLSRYAKSITGIDKDKIAIEFSEKKYKKGNITYICAFFERFKTNIKYDVIVCFQTIEHIKNTDYFIKHICHFLKKRGFLVISTPNGPSQSYNENPYHYREFSSKELKNILKKNFHTITMYGLYGNKKIRIIEKKRKQIITFLLKFDFIGLRHLLPRIVRQVIFNYMSYVMKLFVNRFKKTKDIFSTKDFHMVKNKTKNAIDLIAICRNQL